MVATTAEFIREISPSGEMLEADRILAALQSAPKPLLVEMAAAHVITVWHSVARAEVRKMEQEAVIPLAVSRPAPKRWKNPKRMGKAEFAEFRETHEYIEWRKNEDDLEALAAKHREAMYRDMNSIISNFLDNAKVEWSKELLDSQFSLPDGTVVTWGSASRSDHEARIEMFKSQAAAGIEGAARHQQAIEELDAAGVQSLDALGMAVAA